MISTDAYTNPEQQADESRSADNQAFLEEMRENVRNSLDVLRHTFVESRNDAKFLTSDQWDEIVKQARVQDRRPCLSFPKLNQFIDGVAGAQMQSTPSIKVRPTGGPSMGRWKTAAGKSIEQAKALSSIVRGIERNSNARDAYNWAYEGLISFGFGHWRLLNQYVEDSFDQVVSVARIHDHWAVLWDAAAVMPSRDDAWHCAVTSKMSKALFKRLYPNAVAAGTGWESSLTGADVTNWVSGDLVTYAEYFRRVPRKATLVEMSDGRLYRADEGFEAVKDELAQRYGITVTREREHEFCDVEWRLVSGVDVLSGPKVFPSRYIPIVSIWGRPQWLEGSVQYRGLVRPAKDEQMAYNYSRTAAIETVALAPKAPWVLGKSQVAGFEHLYEDANVKNQAYLPYDDSTNPNPPQRNAGGVNLAGVMELVALSEAGMKSSVGLYEANLGDPQARERSGKAKMADQSRGDAMTYPYLDALRIGIEHTGRILVDMIPRVYDTRRELMMLHEDGSEDAIVVNNVVKDEQTGRQVKLNDLSTGRYGVTCAIGPSSVSKRAEASEAMTDFISAVPAAGPVIMDLVAANQDWDGSEIMAKRLRALVPPQALQAGDETGEDDMPPAAKAAVQQAQQAVQVATQQVQAVTQAAEEQAQRAAAAEAEADAAKRAMQAQKVELDLAKREMQLAFDERLLKLTEQVDNMREQSAAQVKAIEERAVTQGAQGAQQVQDVSAQVIQGLQASVESQQAGMQAVLAGIAKMVEAVVANGQQQAAAMQQVAQVMAAPRQVITDADGNPTGVVPVLAKH